LHCCGFHKSEKLKWKCPAQGEELVVLSLDGMLPACELVAASVFIVEETVLFGQTVGIEVAAVDEFPVGY